LFEILPLSLRLEAGSSWSIVATNLPSLPRLIG